MDGQDKTAARRKGPSAWFYALAVPFPPLGVAVFVILLVGGIMGAGDMIRVIVPGSNEITLTRAGAHTIYYEHQSVVGGRVFSTGPAVSGLRVTLVSKSTGIEVSLRPVTMNMEYSFPGHQGQAVLDFSVDQPGTYVLSGGYPGADGPEVVLAVGRGIGKRLAVGVCGAIAAMFGSFAITAGILGLVYFLRRRAAAAPRTNG